MHSWNIFGARTSHEQTQIHKTYHGSNLGKAPPSPLKYSLSLAMGSAPKCHFVPRIPKFPKLGLLQLWRPITLCVDFRLKWGLKQSCNPCRNFSNGMWHITCTQGNQGNSCLLVVENQIGNLTPDPFFGHNLFFKCQMGHASPFLNIYIPKYFQWYKELFNPMSFDPYKRPLKIRELIGIRTRKVRSHLRVRGLNPSNFPKLPRAWNVTPSLHFWLAPLQALALVMNPRLGLWHYGCNT
jgi:hypothetical protein